MTLVEIYMILQEESLYDKFIIYCTNKKDTIDY